MEYKEYYTKSFFLAICIIAATVPAEVVLGESLFISTRSGNFYDSSTWRVGQGVDKDGIPDADDSIVIVKNHEIEYLGTAESASIQDIRIEKGGRLLISSIKAQTLWIAGRVDVQGSFEVSGPHRLVFESSEHHVAGIKIFPGASFKFAGHLTGTYHVMDIHRPNDQFLHIRLQEGSYASGALIGKKIKFLNGLARNLVFDIVESKNNTIVVDLESRGWGQNAGTDQPIEPISISSNKIQAPPSLVTNKLFSHRSKNDQAGQYIGKWVQFVESGNKYFIVGSANGTQHDTLTLLSDVEEVDYEKTFRILSGISPGDRFVIMDYATATIPEFHRDEAIYHALLYAENANVVVKYAEFSYFGSHLENDAKRYGSWPDLVAGLSFRNFDNSGADPMLLLDFVDIHHGAALIGLLLWQSESVELSHIYMWDVHPSINPESSEQAGHGIGIYHARNLHFNENVVLNQGDDHLYVGGDSRNATFSNNTFINSPLPRGNSANNLEMKLQGSGGDIRIEGNIFLATDGNVNLVFPERTMIELQSNIIGTTLTRGSANLALKNTKGLIESNIVMNGAQAIVITGESNVVVSNNVIRDAGVAVRNPTQLSQNLIFDGMVNVTTRYGSFEAPILIDSNTFWKSNDKTNRVIYVRDPTHMFFVDRHIKNNWIYIRATRDIGFLHLPFVPMRYQFLAPKVLIISVMIAVTLFGLALWLWVSGRSKRSSAIFTILSILLLSGWVYLFLNPGHTGIGIDINSPEGKTYISNNHIINAAKPILYVGPGSQLSRKQNVISYSKPGSTFEPFKAARRICAGLKVNHGFSVPIQEKYFSPCAQL